MAGPRASHWRVRPTFCIIAAKPDFLSFFMSSTLALSKVQRQMEEQQILFAFRAFRLVRLALMLSFFATL